jgi:hypothetical protein
MAYKKKANLEVAPEPVNTEKQFVITSTELRGQINNKKYTGKQGDVLTMEPWEAKLLSAYVKEVN